MYVVDMAPIFYGTFFSPVSTQNSNVDPHSALALDCILSHHFSLLAMHSQFRHQERVYMLMHYVAICICLNSHCLLFEFHETNTNLEATSRVTSQGCI